jgi:AcrR family transcriptional regulator
MPKAFTEHERGWIAERLVGAGYELFSAYGLHKTSVAELARAAGISKGAFYGFYASKEALFMDVIERAEVRFRQEIFAAIDLPGPSPRARLYALLKKAFSLLETLPVLQFLTGRDYDHLFRRMPPAKVRQHLASDRAFLDEFIARCRRAGIPIRATSAQIAGLLYPLVLTILHADDFGAYGFTGSIDLLLELVAAFCLGEVEIHLQEPARPLAGQAERQPL